MSSFKETLLWIWQLPQNLVGWFVFNMLEAKSSPIDKGVFLHHKSFFSSVSLGKYIILNEYQYNGKTLRHEYGHQKQSQYLGWFYLPVIGLPSVIGNLIFRIEFIRKRLNYYHQPWEKWADKLGDVDR